MALLSNGLDFIESALSNVTDTASDRDLKYAVLHLSSGIDLILKERLRREHWTLLFQKPEVASLSSYESGDFLGVNSPACVERLINVCDVAITPADAQAHRRLRKIRNRMEHSSFHASVAALKVVVARALTFLVDFVAQELGGETLSVDDAEVLARIRARLRDFRAFVDKRWSSIAERVSAATETVLECPRCSQEAAIVSEGLECLFCGHAGTAVVEAAEYMHAAWGCDRDDPHEPSTCLACDALALVQTRPELNAPEYVCLECGQAWPLGQLDSCSRCNELFDPGPDGPVVCSDCFAAAVAHD